MNSQAAVDKLVERAVLAEREACAALAERQYTKNMGWGIVSVSAAKSIAKAIRSRTTHD